MSELDFNIDKKTLSLILAVIIVWLFILDSRLKANTDAIGVLGRIAIDQYEKQAKKPWWKFWSK